MYASTPGTLASLSRSAPLFVTTPPFDPPCGDLPKGLSGFTTTDHYYRSYLKYILLVSLLLAGGLLM